MAILDYIIIGVVAIGLIVGIVKGFIKQLLTLLGILVVAIGTAYLCKFPQMWFSGLIENQTILTVVSFLVTIIALSLVYSLLAFFIRKAFKSVKIISVLDRILGMLSGILMGYAIMALVIALFQNTGEDFMAFARPFFDEQIQQSVLVQYVFTPNILGDWLTEVIRSSLAGILG